MANIKKSKIGEINYNNFGSKMKIIKYNRSDDIDIYFEEYNWIYRNTQYDKFKKGNIKCPYERRVHGVGYLGEGKYKCRENNRDTKCYKTWFHMLERCYDEKYHIKRPTYIGCTVCEEWHNFQNFAKWYYKNYYEIEGEIMCLDKDILVKGNKIYSPENCVFVSNRINVLFCKKDRNRGEYPIGISFHSKGDNLRVRCNDKNNKIQLLGFFRFDQVEEAFQVYKQYKEKVIKQVADEYKDKIPQKLYDAMYRYKVEITD